MCYTPKPSEPQRHAVKNLKFVKPKIEDVKSEETEALSSF